MDSDEINLIRETWPALASQADTLTTAFYARLFEIDPDAAKLFAHVDMPAQRKKLALTLDTIVQALDNPDSLLPVVSALGKRHTHYGVQYHHFDSVGEALLAALGTTLGATFTQDVHDAWANAYTLLAAVMKRALARSGATSVVQEDTNMSS